MAISISSSNITPSSFTLQSNVGLHWRNFTGTLTDGSHVYNTGNGTNQIISREFTITFNKVLDEATVSPSTINVTYGSTYGTLANWSATGKTFIGWFTAATGGTEITSSTVVNLSADQILYAHYSADILTITFKSNYPSISGLPEVITTQEVTYGASISSIPDTSLLDEDWVNSHVFDGWYTATTGGIKLTTSYIFNEHSVTTFYAHWKCKLRVYNNVEVLLSDDNLDYNSVVNEPDHSSIKNFIEWVDGLNSDTKVNFPFNIRSNTNIYAYVSSGKIPGGIVIGWHSFDINASYLSEKSGRNTSDFSIQSIRIPAYYGQKFSDDGISNTSHIEIITDGDYGVDRSILIKYSDITSQDSYKSIIITQTFPLFSRFDTFDSDEYIAVAEGWGNDSNSGDSWDSPKKTLSGAISSSKIILVFDGKYSSQSVSSSTYKLVNGSESIYDNSSLSSKDTYTGSFVTGTGGGTVVGNTYYDKKDPPDQDNSIYIRCTFTNIPSGNNCTFRYCVFIDPNNDKIPENSDSCFIGLRSELGLNAGTNPTPKYGSILLNSAEDSIFSIVDNLGQPRNRSGIDAGCYEYQYKFIPNNINLYKIISEGATLTSSNPSSNFKWFDNSNSGYPFIASINVTSGTISDYSVDYYYDSEGIYKVNKEDIYDTYHSNSVYILVDRQIDSDTIYVDNLNYSNNSMVLRKVYLKSGIITGYVVSTIQSALRSIKSGKTIKICRGIYNQSNNQLSISKNVNIISDAGADETILLGDNSDSTKRFITITSGNVNITGLTIINSKSKKTEKEDSENRYGGAISNLGSGILNIVACRFMNCKANIGGSVYNGDLSNCIVDGSSIEGFSKSYSYRGGNKTLSEKSDTIKLIDKNVKGFTISPSKITLTFNINSGAHQYTYPSGHILAGRTYAHYCKFTITINNVTKSLRSGRNSSGIYDYTRDANNDAGGTIVFRNIEPPTSIKYSIDYEGHEVGPGDTYMTVSIPEITWTNNLTPTSAITNKNIKNCTILGDINNSNICSSASNCINLSNQSLSGSTNINADHNSNLDHFKRMPYNIKSTSESISGISLVDNGGTDVNNMLDFNLEIRGLQS